MASQVVIIHGWSDKSDSFHPLRDFLETKGYATAQLWLADYISMADDVRIEDVAKRMGALLSDMVATGKLNAGFDMIVHSTGGLVAREWISGLIEKGITPPIKHLIMLAPANFGSKLATMGKSMIGRLIKGWDNWFHTGEQMLCGLELASSFQWNLARRDLFDPSHTGIAGAYGHGKIWPFVIVGTVGYPNGLRQVVHENGSDGTVRASAANLNAIGMTVDFSGDPRQPTIQHWPTRVGATAIPFAVVPDKNHGTIIAPSDTTGGFPDGTARVGRLILSALECDSDAQYDALVSEWDAISEKTASLVADATLRQQTCGSDPGGDAFHQYMQIFVRARDDQNNPIDDFFLEFYAPLAPGDSDSVFFHREILEDVHPNSQSGSFRCLFLDRTDLMMRFYNTIDGQERQVAMSVSAAPLGDDVHYFNNEDSQATGELIVHAADVTERDGLPGRLRRNTTHLIELILPRQAASDVFKLTQ